MIIGHCWTWCFEQIVWCGLPSNKTSKCRNTPAAVGGGGVKFPRTRALWLGIGGIGASPLSAAEFSYRCFTFQLLTQFLISHILDPSCSGVHAVGVAISISTVCGTIFGHHTSGRGGGAQHQSMVWRALTNQWWLIWSWVADPSCSAPVFLRSPPLGWGHSPWIWGKWAMPPLWLRHRLKHCSAPNTAY